MKTHWKIARMGLVMSMMLCIVSPVHADDESDLENLQNQQSQVQQEQNENSAELWEAQNKVNAVVAAVEELDQQISEKEISIQELDAAIEENLERLTKAKEDLLLAQEEEAYWYEALKQRIQLMYESGNVSYLEVLLKAESMSDLFSKLEYSRELATKDQEIMGELTASRENIQVQKTRIEEEEAILETNRAEEQAEKAELQSIKDEKDSELQSLRSDAAALELYQQQLEALESEIQAQIAETEEAIAARIAAEEQAAAEKAAAEKAAAEKAAVEKAAAEQAAAEKAAAEQAAAEKAAAEKAAAEKAAAEQQTTQENQSTNEETEAPQEPVSQPVPASGLQWPVYGYSYISSPFGYRYSPLTGVYELHRGIDIPAPAGTPIHAAAAGTVITACYNVSYGNYVMIAHDNGLVTLYAHATSLNVSVGQTVAAGDVVSFVGSTGDSNGNHCHFEVRLNGSLQDPLGYVSP